MTVIQNKVFRVKVKCKRTKPEVCGHIWNYAGRQDVLSRLNENPVLAKMVRIACSKCNRPINLFSAIEAAKNES